MYHGARVILQSSFREILSGLQDLLLPAFCEECAKRLSAGECFFCEDCLQHALKLGFGWAGVTGLPGSARLRYEEPGRQMLSRVKYGLSTELCQQLCNGWGAPVWLRGALVPVPAHAVRKRERGGNAAMLLTRVLARQWKLPIRNVLKRTSGGQQQKSLDRQSRLSNLEGQYHLKRQGRGESLVLVDDVSTTGATLLHLSDILRKGGYEVCGCCVLAWTPRHSDGA